MSVTRLRQFRTLAFYFAIPAISAVTPLLVLPALTAEYGARGLAAIGIGQSLGSTAAVIGELGWGVLGPQRIARATLEGRRQMYELALATKISALSLVVPLAALAAYYVADDHQAASALIAFAFGLTAMSPSWFLTGLNKPILILLGEALPRLVLSAGVAIAILAGAPLELYGLSLLAAVCITWVLVARVTGQRLWPSRQAFRAGPGAIRTQLPLTGGRIVSVLYTFLPVTLVALISPSSTATFTAADRLMRMALSLLGGVPQRLQSWVGVMNGHARLNRSRQSLMMNAMLGLVAGLGFAVCAPWVAVFVFSGSVTIDIHISAISGAAIFVICASRGFGLSLVAEGKANWIAAANIGAALTGVASIYLFAREWGTHGALLGTLSAEIVGLLIQALTLFFGYRWVKVDLYSE